MAYTTAWLIGSIKSLDADVTIAGSAENVTGSLYLYSPTSALSLLAQFVVAMTAAGVAGAAAVLTRDRKVKLSAGGVFTVTWTDTDLRDLLGFSQGNLAGSATYTAASVSPLLWSPQRTLGSELSPLGTLGIRRPLAYFTASPSDGSTFVVSHGERVDQRFGFPHVDTDRVYTEAEAGGEWVRFFDDCLARGYSFHAYPEVTEDPGSGTTATLTGGLGPYVLTPEGRAPSWSYRRGRGQEWTDRRADIVLACRLVPEYT